MFGYELRFAGLAAQQAEAQSELDVDHPRRPCARFAKLARTGLVQSRACLHPSAHRTLVPRPASASHASRMAAHLSSLFVPAVISACGNDLAVVANDSVAG